MHDNPLDRRRSLDLRAAPLDLGAYDLVYERIDAPATREQKSKLKRFSPKQVDAKELAGDPIIQMLSEAPGNNYVVADAVRIAQATGTAPAGAQELATMLMAYADQDSKRFNESLAGYETVLRRSQTQSLKKARLETFFNRYNLFFKCQLLYLL